MATFVSAIPQTINVHGKLSNSSGSLEGIYQMNFSIYNSSTGEDPLYEKFVNVTTDGSGVYNAILDDVNLSFSEQYYLGIAVENDTEMVPRINLTSSPYAYIAQNVSAGGIIFDENIDMGSQNITTKGTGFFGFLGSLATRVSKLWVDEINATGNIVTVGNVSAGYYIGDGSQLTGTGTGDAYYEFGANNFNGSGNFVTTGNITGGNILIGNSSTNLSINLKNIDGINYPYIKANSESAVVLDGGIYVHPPVSEIVDTSFFGLYSREFDNATLFTYYPSGYIELEGLSLDNPYFNILMDVNISEDFRVAKNTFLEGLNAGTTTITSDAVIGFNYTSLSGNPSPEVIWTLTSGSSTPPVVPGNDAGSFTVNLGIGSTGSDRGKDGQFIINQTGNSLLPTLQVIGSSLIDGDLNVTGLLYGNGSQLTGLATGTGDADYDFTDNNFNGSGNFVTTGNVNATLFNGVNLSALGTGTGDADYEFGANNFNGSGSFTTLGTITAEQLTSTDDITLKDTIYFGDGPVGEISYAPGVFTVNDKVILNGGIDLHENGGTINNVEQMNMVGGNMGYAIIDFGTNTIRDGYMTGNWDFGSGDLNTTGNVTANYFKGDGSGLTNLNLTGIGGGDADYEFEDNNFNGSGNFVTTGIGTFGNVKSAGVSAIASATAPADSMYTKYMYTDSLIGYTGNTWLVGDGIQEFTMDLRGKPLVFDGNVSVIGDLNVTGTLYGDGSGLTNLNLTGIGGGDAYYEFGTNNFNGSGNFVTTGDLNILGNTNLKNTTITGDTITQDASPTNAGASFDYGGGPYYNYGVCHTIRVYAYKEVNGKRAYSSSYLESAEYCDNGQNDGSSYTIDWTWDAAAEATGYRVLKSDDENGDYVRYKDTVTNYFTDSSSFSSGNIVEPTTSYTDTLAVLGEVSIGTTDREFDLTMEGDGIISKGLGGRTLTTSGAGTRFIWYPKKAAIRFGEVTGTQWDDANIGSYSIAGGLNPKASATSTIAFGNNAQATGDDAIALGKNTLASSVYATAIGGDAQATALHSIAIGFHAEADGQKATAVGSYNVITEEYGTAVGYNNNVSVIGGLALGRGVTVSGTTGVGIGYNIENSIASSIGMGIGSLNFVLNSDGVSINTGLAPTVALDVSGDGKFSGDLNVTGLLYGDGSGLIGINGMNYTNLALTNTSNTFDSNQFISGNLNVTQNLSVSDEIQLGNGATLSQTNGSIIVVLGSA